ncbi:sterol carrier protein 2 [Mucidula mucida]|nr:sterol carrier protein 2 [Mucidula mucida]
MGLEAATKALLDAGIAYDEVELASVGYCYGDSTAGQRSLYALGLTSIPITNVNNNCSTGSTALFAASSAVRYGQASCALALGFEQMKPGSLGSNFPDRPSPTALLNQRSAEAEEALEGNHGPGAPRMFDNAAKEYFKKYGCGSAEDLGRIASKNHKHSVNNPYSQFRDGWSVEQVMKGKKITDQLTVYMCSPTSDGAACCIVADEAFVKKHGLENQAIEIVASALMTDTPSAYKGDAMDIVGYGMSRKCADKVFQEANASRDDVGVVELHDCFASNELVTYDALRLCPDGGAVDMVRRGDNTYGGKYVINPSGGLEAKGHPLGATGLGMHFYITMQLRNWAGPMQAPGLFPSRNPRGKYGLVHNLGLGGAVVVSLLRRPEFWKEGGQDGRDRLGYNHACVCRGVTRADVDKVKSRRSASEYVLQAAKL